VKLNKIFLILALLTLFSGCSPAQNEIIKTPNFIGLKVGEAQALAKNTGLNLQVVLTQPSSQYPIDTIISQDPEAGTDIKKGGFVKIVLSSGPVTVVVPNVIGKTFEEARKAILDAGLTIGKIEEIEVDTPVGSVISQSPDPDTIVTPNSKVDITISIGTFVVVPNVIGKSVAEAKSILESAGLVLYKVDTFDKPVEGAPSGIVLYQYPMPNAKVEKGTQVLLRVSK